MFSQLQSVRFHLCVLLSVTAARPLRATTAVHFIFVERRSILLLQRGVTALRQMRWHSCCRLTSC